MEYQIACVIVLYSAETGFALKTVACQNNKHKTSSVKCVFSFFACVSKTCPRQCSSKCHEVSRMTPYIARMHQNVHSLILVLNFGLGSQMVRFPCSFLYKHIRNGFRRLDTRRRRKIFYFPGLDLDCTHLKLVVSMAGHWETAGLDNVTTSQLEGTVN